MINTTPSRRNSVPLSPLEPRARGLVMYDFLEERRQACRNNGIHDYSVNAFVEWALPRLSRSKAQLFQDLFVLWILGEKRDGFFVEFGATDGVDLSNTHLLEYGYDWSGILAEPNPNYHDTLFAERQCAISTHCVYTQTGLDLPFMCTSLPQLSRLVDVVPNDHHEATGRRQANEIVQVETITLNELLDSHNAPNHIDYMSIDTEGSELDILESFDWCRDVAIFTIEHNGTDMRNKLNEILVAKGYVRPYAEFTRFDDWYIRPDLCGDWA